jgi:DNA-binding response OmpR family regulator
MKPENSTIVVIEDDPDIADLLDLYLRRDGHRVLLASSGERGLELVQQNSPRMVILDIGLAGEIDGIEVCRRLRTGDGRAIDGPTAVMMLTARDSEIDRVLGLEMGADDYVTKPFSPREVTARVKAILRRLDPAPAASTASVWENGSIRVEVARRDVTLDGVAEPIAAREFDLLMHLIDNRGIALTRQQLLDGVWGPDWYGDERTVDVHVRQLRKKLGEDLPLATVWGVGYRLG